ncbi:hypothetical protein BG015_007838 [Linnemannia schmuckeri]|uniref:Uncharacterized protein n=1 Tax=Linnemannia schmuckeri TaxID=64567 RepID=A0A9P5RYF8_9FUNG|nr:hypothetical protein BG015_007838 [Linnemannia schmuckeri]
MARPERTFRPADLEEDAPPPYAATAPESGSTVPDPQQYQPSYPTLDTSYIVQQQQQHQQLQQQLSVGLPNTPPPPIHYYPVMSSAQAPSTTTTTTTTTTTVAPPPLQYPQYPMISTAIGGTTGASPYPIYPVAASQSTVYHAPQTYPVMMGGGHPSPYGSSAGLRMPAAHTPAQGGGGSAYPVPYPSSTGIPPSHYGGSHFPQSQYYPTQFASPPGPSPPPATAPAAVIGSPAASTATASTLTTASPHFSPSPAHIVAPPPLPQHQQLLQPALVPSTPNVAVTTPAVQPTAPEEKLIDLDDFNGRWEQPEPPRAPHAYTSPVLPPMSALGILSPTPAPAPGASHTRLATSPASSLPYVPPPVPQHAPPPAALPDLVTLYKCRKCGATLDSDTAVCKRIHVGGLSGEWQVNQATEADLNERRKLINHANESGAGVPNNESSSTLGSQGSTESATYDSSHGTDDVYLNHRQYNRPRRSEELVPPHIVSPPALVNESSSSGGALGRATSTVNPSTHQYHSTASTNDNHGTNGVYIRRSFSTQNPVTSLKKLWRDTKKELLTVQQPPYSSRNHELVAPPPLPPPTLMQQQPYPQPPDQYRPSPMYHHQHAGAVPHQQQQQQQHDLSGYPVLGSSTTTTATIPVVSTNPFDDPPTPAYNPAHVPVYIPELPMRQQQQQQQSLPAPSAPPPSHLW